MNKTIVYGGILVAVVLATFSLFQAGKVGPQGPAGKDGTSYGAVTGPDSYFDYVANNNLKKYGKTIGFTTATTTVCAIKSPAATSTLIYGSAQFDTSSTSASTVTLAKATTAFATTTALTRVAVSANAKATVMASTTPLLATGAINGLVFAPSTYFVVGMEGGAGTFSPVGSCSAEFVQN